MARPTGDGLAVVRSPFFAGKRLVALGEVWAADDPVVLSHPSAFKPIEVKSSEPAAPKRPAAKRPAPRRTSRRPAAKKP